MARKLYNFAAFQAGWFACVLGAANRCSWLGPLAALAIIAVHLRIARERDREWQLLAASIPIGMAVNAVLAATGAIDASGSIVGPAWLILLWPLFVTTFNESMRWLMGRYAVSIVFVVGGAPLSYFAGARAGALELGEPAWRWIGLVALTWGLAMPMLLALRERFTPDVRRGR